MACLFHGGTVRPVTHLCQLAGAPGSIGTRDTIIQRPDQVPYLNRDFAQTTSVPAPLYGSWGAQVGLENQLQRSFENRPVGGSTDSTREFVIPLSWSMTPLVHGWQQPDWLSFNQEQSRMMVKDACLTAYGDSIEARRYENLPSCPNPYYEQDCKPNVRCWTGNCRQYRRSTLI